MHRRAFLGALGLLAAPTGAPGQPANRVFRIGVLVEAGGLLAYGIVQRDNFRRAAIFVDKILRGAKPADLPIEQPALFELILNLKTAKALGLTIPPSLLQRADHVIE